MANGTFRIEAKESVDGETYVDKEPDLGHNKGVGNHMVSYTPTPGVRFAVIVVTEEGSGTGNIDLSAGVK